MSFNRYARRLGFHPFSDAEGYEAFDMEYDYDIRELLDAYWAGKRPLHEWIEALNDQEAIYPYNFVKMRCLENHDQPRIAGRIHDARALRNWHAFLFFQKGATLIYAGEERCDRNRPSLFDRDPVRWDGPDVSAELARLAALKKECFPADGWFSAETDDEQHAVLARFVSGEVELAGLFSLRGEPVRMKGELPQGRYMNLLNGETIEIADDELATDGEPIMLLLRDERED